MNKSLKQNKVCFQKALVLFLTFLLVFTGIIPTSLLGIIEAEAATPVSSANSCLKQNRVALINGGFEGPIIKKDFFIKQNDVPGWSTTDPTGMIEIWRTKDKIPLTTPPPAEGEQFAELNAHNPSMLYQDVKTTPGQTIYWRLAHRGRSGTDVMQLRIGSTNVALDKIPVIGKMSDGTGKWGHYTGTYTVPTGQTLTRFGFEAVSTAGGNKSIGNFLDDIFLGTEPCVTATKSVDREGTVYTGDELTYTVNIKNEGGDIASNAIFTDGIPEGTEYVPGSMKITSNSKTSNLTDKEDSDSGAFKDKKVTINLGDIHNVEDDPKGITVQFKVKVLPGYIGKKVVNKAKVDYGNLLKETQEVTETNEVVNEIIARNPVIESVKEAKNLQGKKNFEVGDTIEYTVKMRDKISGSTVKNVMIEDQVPEGLEYVPGTIKVDGKPVTDAQDKDNGHYVNGKVTGKLGDITDTEWHTVVFHAKVKAGQLDKVILNKGKVTGDNVTPQEPEVTVTIDPKNPVIESVKTAKNLQDKKIEVGDTIEYTLKMRNTIAESIVRNAMIEDALPEGLEYVPGTIKIDGKAVTDAIDQDNGHYANGKVIGKLGDVRDTGWHTIVFHAKVKTGQADKEIPNKGKVTGNNVDPQEPEAKIKVEPKPPKMESLKEAKNLQDKKKIEVGDTIEYTVKIRNTVAESMVRNATIEDVLPEGLEYVPGTIKVDGKAVTDAIDQDNGHYVNGKVTGKLGDVRDTGWHTVVFHAKVKTGQAGKEILNIGKVTGDNVDPQEPDKLVKVEYKDPKIIAEKTAKNLQNKKNEVGDTIEYTVTMRNEVEDSIVRNAKIEDQLPKGLAYVHGTLKVDGKLVTDAKDEDKGHYADGQVTGQFGDIQDTKPHTIVFHAKVKEGYADKKIVNIGIVTGSNIPTQKPPAEITVEPLPTGQIEIEKVDAKNSNLKLKDAVFQILDKDGNVVGNLTTDSSGKAISNHLVYGKYKIKEVRAPNGYMLLREPFEVEINSPVQKIIVKNTKSEWIIPDTGGIGTTMIYLFSTMLMALSLLLYFRKSSNN